MARTTHTKALQTTPGPQSFTLPHGFRPRSYEREVFAAYEQGCRRFVLCWHRRSGKDRTCLALTTVAMADRPGLYLHVYPTMELARKAMWIAASKEGQPFLDAFPPAWIVGEPNKTEMLIKLKALPGQPAGSIWKLAGADDPDSLRGLNPVGVVLSEYSEHDPRVWDEVISPILNENEGWVIFNFTPKGKNHAWEIYQTARREVARAHPGAWRWFVSLKTVDDTRRDAPGEAGGPVVPPAVIAQERAEGRDESVIQQESYCSFDGYLRGTIYGDLLRIAQAEGRIRPVPHEVNMPVGACFDIGRSDGTAIWFWQCHGREIHFIDYAEDRLKGADYYAHLLKEGKPYVYSRLLLPHDAATKGFTAQDSTEQFFARLFRGVQVSPKVPVQQGIDMTRRLFARFVFDPAKCARGLECLGSYRRAWNDAHQDYSGEPIHDEFSHGADALRTGVLGGLEGLEFYERPTWTHAEMRFDLFRHEQPERRDAEMAFNLFAR